VNNKKVQRATVLAAKVSNLLWREFRAWPARTIRPSDFDPASAVTMQLDWGARASSPAAFGVPPKAFPPLRWGTEK
jgi:hypothetical protein